MKTTGMTFEEIVARWDGDLEFGEWWAVDSYNPNTMQMRRVAVLGDRDEADRLVCRLCEPSDFAMSPFYRAALVPAAEALRFFQGDDSIDREDGFLSVTEAAERLGVTRARVHQLIKGGKLEAERVGSVFMVYETSVDRRLEATRPAEEHPSRRPFQMYELEAFLGGFAEDFDVDAIVDEATYVDYTDGDRYWVEGIDLGDVCARHDVSGKQ